MIQKAKELYRKYRDRRSDYLEQMRCQAYLADAVPVLLDDMCSILDDFDNLSGMYVYQLINNHQTGSCHDPVGEDKAYQQLRSRIDGIRKQLHSAL